MNAIDNELTAILTRRASTVVVEDGLDSILDDTAVVRATSRHRPDPRSRVLAVAAATLLAVGAGGLLWATGDGSSTLPVATSPVPEPAPSFSPPDRTTADQVPNETDAVHLQLGDGWELTFADTNQYRSTWTSTARTSDEPDAQLPTPSVHLTTNTEPSSLLDSLAPSNDVTIAGIATTLYSNQDDSVHVAMVPLNDDHTVEVIIENVSADRLPEIIAAVVPMTASEWDNVLEARSAPVTTITSSDG